MRNAKTLVQCLPEIVSRVGSLGRVILTEDVETIVHALRGVAPTQTVSTVMHHLVKEGVIGKVRRGLYENMTASPRLDPVEITHHVRTGAVVSLLTVVGEKVGNNSPGYVWAVLPHEPRAASAKASSGQVEFSVPSRRNTFKYEFRVMDATVFHSPDKDDLYDPRFPYPRATVEAALVHWIYLATQERRLRIETVKPMARPPVMDMDFTEVDDARLWRVADAMGMSEPLDRWLQTRSEADHGDDQYSSGLGF